MLASGAADQGIVYHLHSCDVSENIVSHKCFYFLDGWKDEVGAESSGQQRAYYFVVVVRWFWGESVDEAGMMIEFLWLCWWSWMWAWRRWKMGSGGGCVETQWNGGDLFELGVGMELVQELLVQEWHRDEEVGYLLEFCGTGSWKIGPFSLCSEDTNGDSGVLLAGLVFFGWKVKWVL